MRFVLCVAFSFVVCTESLSEESLHSQFDALMMRCKKIHKKIDVLDKSSIVYFKDVSPVIDETAVLLEDFQRIIRNPQSMEYRLSILEIGTSIQAILQRLLDMSKKLPRNERKPTQLAFF